MQQRACVTADRRSAASPRALTPPSRSSGSDVGRRFASLQLAAERRPRHVRARGAGGGSTDASKRCPSDGSTTCTSTSLAATVSCVTARRCLPVAPGFSASTTSKDGLPHGTTSFSIAVPVTRAGRSARMVHRHVHAGGRGLVAAAERLAFGRRARTAGPADARGHRRRAIPTSARSRSGARPRPVISASSPIAAATRS